MAGTAFFRIPLPPEGPAGQAILDKQWTLLNDAMDRAEILGTDRLRTFAFMSPKEEPPAIRITIASTNC